VDIYTILLEQQQTYKNWINKSSSVPREVGPTYESYLSTPMIKVIMGPRRSGKSFFSIQSLPQAHFIYINFDDERFFELTTKDLNKIYEAGLRINSNPQYWVFDEIQNIQGWELFVNRLKRNGLNIIVTGSNSKLLSKELATHLTGRTLSLELLPFSFREYLKFYQIEFENNLTTENFSEIKNHFMKYLRSGGFPETLSNIAFNEYLRELFDRIITKDIIQRYQIRDPRTLRAIAHIMMSYNSQELSYQKIKNSFPGLSINTLRKYISYIEDTYLFFEIETYSTKIRERLTKARKIYCIDSGMFNALSDNPERTFGRQLENLVFLELRRKNKSVSYLKTKNFEIDFILSEHGKISQLIQVSWNFDDPKTKDRELKSFIEAEKVLGPQKKMILTYDIEETIGHIMILPVWKWLTQYLTK
jgi:predicted AAA+ superfamily ATPase